MVKGLRVIMKQIPGQKLVLQFLDCDAGPKHEFPPPDGGGLLQEWVLLCIPPPQVLLQEENPVHAPH